MFRRTARTATAVAIANEALRLGASVRATAAPATHAIGNARKLKQCRNNVVGLQTARTVGQRAPTTGGSAHTISGRIPHFPDVKTEAVPPPRFPLFCQFQSDARHSCCRASRLSSIFGRDWDVKPVAVKPPHNFLWACEVTFEQGENKMMG